MKKITKLIALLVLPAAMLTSCGDDDSGSTNNNNNSTGEFLTAKVDGQTFEAASEFDAIAASSSSGALIVQGSNSQGRAIQITLMSYDGPGTYNMSNIIQGQLLYTIASPFTSYSSAAGDGANGTLEITLDDGDKIEGNFSFTGRKAEENATETVSVTDGSFRANFQ